MPMNANVGLYFDLSTAVIDNLKLTVAKNAFNKETQKHHEIKLYILLNKQIVHFS